MKKVFFSYVGVAPINESAYRAASAFLKDYRRLGTPEVIEKYQGHVARLGKAAGTLLNCDPSEITYVKNTGEGLIIASEALPLRKGDEVLVQENEYPANFIPWLKKRKDGIKVRVIKGTDNDKAFRELIAAINPKTKAIAIAWVQHYDGYLTDLASLSRICRKKGIFLVVDAVQGVGIRHLDLKKVQVDFLVCGGQKYLGAMGGIGFMYVNKKIMNKLKDTKVGIRSVERFDADGYVIKKTAERFGDGTENLLGIVMLVAGIEHVNRIGIKNIERMNIALLNKFKSYLKKNDVPFIDHKNQGNIISLRVSDPNAFVVFLRKNNIYIRPRKDVARISFMHTSRMSDFKKLVLKTKEWMRLHPSSA